MLELEDDRELFTQQLVSIGQQFFGDINTDAPVIEISIPLGFVRPSQNIKKDGDDEEYLLPTFRNAVLPRPSLSRIRDTDGLGGVRLYRFADTASQGTRWYS